MKKQFFDLTKEKPDLNKKAEDICLDFDDDCPGMGCALTCWLYAPERGICPLLNEEKHGKSSN